MNVNFEIGDLEYRILIGTIRDAVYRANADVEIARNSPRFRKHTLEQRQMRARLLQKAYEALPDPAPLPGLKPAA